MYGIYLYNVYYTTTIGRSPPETVRGDIIFNSRLVPLSNLTARPAIISLIYAIIVRLAFPGCA